MSESTNAPAREVSVPKSYLITAACVVLAAFLSTLALPQSEYVAWQAGAGTEMEHARWVYERLAFDKSPIEIALVGSSRMEAGVSTKALERDLTQKLGRPVPVANLSIVRPGRDLQFKIVQKLLDTHPETKMIILADDGFMANSHPLFREVAMPYELLEAPALINTSWFTNILALPYRQLRNFFATLRPEIFGVNRKFSSANYQGTDFDRSEGYVLPTGEQRNGNRSESLQTLQKQAEAAIKLQNKGIIGKLHLLSDQQKYPIDYVYTDKIARLAQQRGARLVFVAIPAFGPTALKGDRALYCQYGPDFDLQFMAAFPDYYQDGLHMNHSGALVATQVLAEKLTPLMLNSKLPGRC